MFCVKVKTKILFPLFGLVLLSACADSGKNNSESQRTNFPAETNNVNNISETEKKIIAVGRSDFEMMGLKKGAKVDDKAAMSPDGNMNADRLHLPLGASVSFIADKRPVSSGDKFEASVWLWRDTDTLDEGEISAVVLQIVRWCSLTDIEESNKKIYLTDEPQFYSIEHIFEKNHDCAKFQIVGANNGTTVFAWDTKFDIASSTE